MLDNTFSKRWIAAAATDNREGEPLEFLKTGALFVDEASERQTIERQVQDLERKFGTELIKLPIRAFATTEDFAPLKAKCLDLIKQRPGNSEKQIAERKQISDLLQRTIRYESLYHPDHHFQCDLKVKNERRYFFEKNEYDLFTVDRNDGWLYLDYGQIGLPPFAAFLEKSPLLPTPQDSFIGSFQIVYREDFKYPAEDVAKAMQWLRERLKRRKDVRDKLGQIPLARPLHPYSRIEVLNLLKNFDGEIEVEYLENGQPLSPDRLKQSLKREIRSLSLYHPYGRFSLGALAVHSQRAWSERWRLIQPIHALRPVLWKFAFNASAPFRKVLYVANYYTKKGSWIELWEGVYTRINDMTLWPAYKFIGQTNNRLIVQPFHRIRPTLWSLGFKLSWPFRKIYYLGKHVVRKYVLRKNSDT